MQFVYLCRDGENEELRYSIRSVVKYFPDAEIWLVGGKPSWYSGNFVEVKQSKTKFENVHNNLKAICDSEELDEEIVMMNDDFFIVDEIDHIPYIVGGTLRNKIVRQAELGSNSKYVILLRKMYKDIKKNGISEPLDYTLHVPMRVERSKLKPVVERTVAWRSTYGNIYNVGGEVWDQDVKVYSRAGSRDKVYDFSDLKYPFLSSSDASFPILKRKVLGTMFPEPSKYEK